MEHIKILGLNTANFNNTNAKSDYTNNQAAETVNVLHIYVKTRLHKFVIRTAHFRCRTAHFV